MKPEEKQRDAERTKQKLLACAKRLFVEKGYHAVGVDEIAEAANVNKRMIYAYFKSKRGIYDEVISHIFAEMERLDFQKVEATDAYPDKLETALRIYFDFLKDHPEFVRLLSWEKLYADKDSIKQLLSHVNRMLTHLFVLIELGKDAGEICPDADIPTLTSCINALFIGFFSNKAISEELWGGEFVADQNQNHIFSSMIRLVFHGIMVNKGSNS